MADKLLPGWFEAKDPSGKSYYYTAEGKTSWDRPSAPVDTTPKAIPAATQTTSTTSVPAVTTKPAGGMGSLLGEIQKGARLKKAETNDRSAPPVAGKPVGGNEGTTGSTVSRPSSTASNGGGGGGAGAGAGAGAGGGGSLMEQIANAKLKKASAPVPAAVTAGESHDCDTSIDIDTSFHLILCILHPSCVQQPVVLRAVAAAIVAVDSVSWNKSHKPN